MGKQTDLRLGDFEDWQADYGAIALIEREVEWVFTEAQLAYKNTIQNSLTPSDKLTEPKSSFVLCSRLNTFI